MPLSFGGFSFKYTLEYASLDIPNENVFPEG